MNNRETGCIALATRSNVSISIDRVIEAFDPKRGHLWFDIFLTKPLRSAPRVSLLHRGNLSAENVTSESWRASSLRARTSSCKRSDLTGRILRLHKSFD